MPPTVSFTSGGADIKNTVTVSAQTSTETTSVSGEIMIQYGRQEVVNADDTTGIIDLVLAIILILLAKMVLL